MEDLFLFDDALFVEKKKEVTEEGDFEAHQQDPCWFLTIDVNNLPPYVDKLTLLKNKGDYFYSKNNYQSAIFCYEEMLTILPENNVVTRRECYENLARCFSKDKQHCKSLHSSHLLHATSRTAEHLTVSLTCLLDTHVACAAHPGAVLACVKLIALHKLNSRLWLRMAQILAQVLMVELPDLASIVHSESKLEESCDDKFCVTDISESLFHSWDGSKKHVLVLFCLMMSKYIMTGVRGTSVGFTAGVLCRNIQSLEGEISRIIEAYSVSATLVSRLDCIVTKNVFGYDKNVDCESEEKSDFVDRGSSKFRGEVLEISYDSVLFYSLEDFRRDWFDDVFSIL